MTHIQFPNQAKHILVVEDDPAVGRSLQDGLTREGYTVTWKKTGGEGLSSAGTAHTHLIILDVRLPDGSGFDFCRRMRQAGIHQPILILTVQSEELDKVLGLEMGADDYLTKPYSLRELLARVRALLRRAYGELSTENTLLYAGDLTIDLARAQVLHGREPLSLTPTEFRLLVYLVQNAQQALTRPQILAAVWGYDTDVEDEKTVNVQIRRLREKVELDPSHPTLILTVPGIGYRCAG
ncbi:cell wall metabolism DNA-binding response regulator WalR [soil metagenome]